MTPEQWSQLSSDVLSELNVRVTPPLAENENRREITLAVPEHKTSRVIAALGRAGILQADDAVTRWPGYPVLEIIEIIPPDQPGGLSRIVAEDVGLDFEPPLE